MPAADVMGAPRPVAIVEGLVWEGRITVVVSESGTGKTFLLQGAAAAVSDGVPWHGRAVQPGSVAYVSFEGDAHGPRLRALRAAGHRLEHIHILSASEPLSPMNDRDRMELPSRGEVIVTEALDALRESLVKARRPPIVLVVIDTVRASMTGSEDSSDAVSAFLRSIRRISAYVPTAGVVLAHHAGWQDGEDKRKRERGSSAWRGNVDCTVYLESTGTYDRERGEARLTLRALKVRDTERPADLHLVRRRVELPELAGDDIRQGPVTSCVIELDRRTREDREAEQNQADETAHRETDVALLRVLRDHPDATSQRKLRAYMGVNFTAVGDALTRVLRAGWVEPPTKQRHPYVVTETGHAALAEASCPSRTE